MRAVRSVAVCAVLLAACGGADGSVSSEPTASTASTAPANSKAPGDECAHVRAVTVVAEGGGTFSFEVTVASTETGWDKYADAWEIRGPGGVVLGERVLAHPHETEQPFTRSLSGVAISSDIAEVTVAAHDLVLGFCGEEMTVAVPHET